MRRRPPPPPPAAAAAARAADAPRRRAQPPRSAGDCRAAFLQANFRFLVCDAADLRRHEADPDLMLEWDDVVSVEVLARAADAVRCPITLDRPLCAQITPCGHVFSFPAIMAHLQAHGGPELRAAAPCPLCYTAIAARELRLARVREVAPPAEGGEATFRLLRRPRGSIIPEPAPPASPRAAAPAGAPPECSRFSKFTPVGPDGAQALWQAEARRVAAYAAQVIAEGGWDAALEGPAATAAVEALAQRARLWAERRQRVLAERHGEAAPSPEAAGLAAAQQVRDAAAAAAAKPPPPLPPRAPAAPPPEFPPLPQASRRPPLAPPAPAPAPRPGAAPPRSSASPAIDVPPGASLGASPGGASPCGSDLLSSSARAARYGMLGGASPPDAGSPGAGGGAGAGCYYSYQLADGQAVFLCPLDMRVLLAHHGSYAAFPRALTARVLELEDFTQTEASRRRMKVLGHLPLGGEFRLAEVDLSAAVPAAALEPFREELAAREARRAARAGREARRRAREAAAEAAAAAAAAAGGPSAAELRRMPALPGAVDRMDEEQDAGGSSEGGASEGSPRDGDANPSFARIAALGFAATGPTLGSSPSGGGRSPALAGAWGARPAAAAAGGGGAWRAPDTSRDAELARSLAAVEVAGGGAAAAGGSAKKGGGKKQVLLSTGHRRY